MSAKAIDDKIIIKRDGQTQHQRMPAWLNPALVPVDDRTKEQFFDYLKAIAKEINYFTIDVVDHKLKPAGTWEEFFALSTGEISDLASKASLPPHIALWHSFMAVYEHSQKLLNTITERHLDFYYKNVLQLIKQNPLPDKAHLLFELRKNTENTLLPTGTVLLAGKDKTKKELHYRLTHDIVVNQSKIVQLKSLYINPANKNYVHYATVANSADGLGGELDKANPAWVAFGNNSLPPAQIGFCLASNVLKMKEGDRTVIVNLTLGNLPVTAKNKALTTNLFKVSVTGEKGWIGPKTVSVIFTSSDDQVFNAAFQFSISKDETAVVAYDAKIHGNDFTTASPLLQILLNNEKSDFGYNDLLGSEIIDATIEVSVSNSKALQLENDFGTMNPAKPFTPFGPSPDVNANFFIKSEEAFTKRLKEFSVDVDWKNIPHTNLDTYFSGYGVNNTNNENFMATASFQDGVNWQDSKTIELFNTNNAKANVRWPFSRIAPASKITFATIPEISILKNKTAGLTVNQKLYSNMSQLVPALAAIKQLPIAKLSIAQPSILKGTIMKPLVANFINKTDDSRTGMLHLSLKKGFLFKEYRKKYTENILEFSKKKDDSITVINEPFAPEMQSIHFNYTAVTSKTSFSSTSLNSYVDEEIELFHYGAFGQMREHAYQKAQHSFVNNTNVKLLPEYKNEGEFFIGLSGLLPGDAACILFQVAEGSAEPDKPKVAITWSVLCDNYWKQLSSEDFIFDTTNGLLTSGVIKFIIPGSATTINTIMPDGLLWLKASIATDSNAVCKLLAVHSNAAIAIFNNQENDPLHLAETLAANIIGKLEKEVAAIKSVKQPYASFGGQMQENNEAFYIRVSERLRHKQRSVALWDYERILLQRFPKIHKVKCINHATSTSFYEPGNVLVILVPDLTNQNAINRFQPRVDKNTVDEVKTFLQAHSTSWAEHHVRNPFYEQVKISVTLQLKPGFEFNYYQKIIDRRLQEFLSPWITDTAGDIHFGGKVTKSMIVKFLEDLAFIEYLTGLTLVQSVGNNGFGSDSEVVEASNPASILVSADRHEIFNSTTA